MSKPGMTVSLNVGTSGKTRLRSLVSTASARTFCVLSCGRPVLKSGIAIGMWPAMRSVTTAGLLR